MREPQSVEWTTSGSHALFMLVTEFIILTANLGTEGAKTAKSMKKGFIIATKTILRVSMVVCFLLCYAVTSAAEITNIHLDKPGTLEKYAVYGFSSDIKITGAVYASDLSYLASQLRGKDDLKTVDLSEATIELSNNNKDNTYTYFQDGEECTDVMLSANSIPESMFEGCTGLKRILLPTSLKQIGNRAFLGSSLLVIDIPPSVSRVGRMAFQACPYLKRVYIYGEPMLGRDAFKNTDKLSDVYVESSTPFAIDANAFSNYDFSLKVHNYDAYKNDAIWGKNEHIFSFYGKLVYASPVTFNLDIPGQLSQNVQWYKKIDIEKISDLKITGKMYASDISWLSSYVMGNNSIISGTLKRLDLSEAELIISDNPEDNKLDGEVLSAGAISANIFNDFCYMDYLGLPNGISGISPRCFGSGSGLIEITIPKTVKYIDQLAFSGNKDISVVDIKKGEMTSIGTCAFYNCSSLISISLPDNIETIDHACFRNCTSLREVMVPFGVDNLSGTFYGCTSLEKVRIGHAEKPTTIGDNTFYRCASLKEVLTLSTITSFGRSCFAGCTSLETFIMPLSLNEIGAGCFTGCNNLKTVYVTPKEFYASKFDTWHFKDEVSVNLLKPYLPALFGDTYRPYRTLCLKNDVLLSKVPYANSISVYSVKGIANGKVVLSEVTNGVLKGGVAYVVSGSNIYGFSTSFYGFTFTLEDGEEPLVENALFQGVYEDIYAPAGSYVLQRDGKFHIVAEDNTIKVGAYHAYLNVPMNTNEPQLVMQFDDGGTTGVDCVTEVEKKTDNRLYDLMGRRVITPQKGHIYVRGNKKIIY